VEWVWRGHKKILSQKIDIKKPVEDCSQSESIQIVILKFQMWIREVLLMMRRMRPRCRLPALNIMMDRLMMMRRIRPSMMMMRRRTTLIEHLTQLYSGEGESPMVYKTQK
jgi:hypothetical protein